MKAQMIWDFIYYLYSCTNMGAILEKRRLNDREINTLVEEIKKFSNPLTGKKTWKSFKKVYIVTSQKDLIGVCGVRKLNNWIKPGPFVVFQRYHHQGYGRKILEAIVDDYSAENIFIGSRNSAVAKIAVRLGFKEISSFWQLPNTVKLYLLGTIFDFFSINFIKEFIRKKPAQEGPYRFFVKKK